ncbi:MAG TPA: DUF1801 domain-containing protein [Ohtaekwangia sp.]|uniref:DUF1801 domain-containing protein n=1 Tax=Ohtaekwangia sp. TaxID=2066019 RepID=UPI002F9415CA
MPAARTIEEMIIELPKEEQVMVKRLRALVAECLPAATEKAYYGEGVIFYTHNRLICYIWPASVTLGSKKKPVTKRTGVALGFNQGYLMSNEDGALLSEGRKQVYVLYLDSLKAIRDDQVRALLFEAGMIDDSFQKKKKRK